MVLANLLLQTTGKAVDSFVTMDVMRLPLGILTGMGFIGAGAILHKGNMVLGVTTAATLWFTTLMGFCFGSGELALGFSLLGLGVFVLWCLEWETPGSCGLLGWCGILCWATSKGNSSHRTHGLASPRQVTQEGEELRYEVHWRASQQDTATPNSIAQLAERPGVKELHWAPLIKG
jgi:putative Mg2+ transporter-C (MgtC) family protein